MVAGRERLKLYNARRTVAWSRFGNGVGQAGRHSTGSGEANEGNAHVLVAARVNIDAGAVLLQRRYFPAMQRREQGMRGETPGGCITMQRLIDKYGLRVVGIGDTTSKHGGGIMLHGNGGNAGRAAVRSRRKREKRDGLDKRAALGKGII